MESKQVLSIEQMQHLQELGLDISNASICYYKEEGWEANYFITLACDIREKGGLIYYYDSFSNKEYILSEVIPAYTLQDVLDALPESLEIGKSKYEISIYMIEGKWAVDYYSETDADIQSLECENLIDAVYSRLCWAIENKFVETNKNE